MTVFVASKELYDTGGELALKEVSRRKAIPKNRVELHVEEAVVLLATEQPALGQFVHQMNCASVVYLYLLVEFVAYGSVMIWRLFQNA